MLIVISNINIFKQNNSKSMKNKKEGNKDGTLQKDKLNFFRSRNAGIEEKM